MGLEARCQAKFGKETGVGMAYLETADVRFSGDFKRRVLLAGVHTLEARNGWLRLHGPDGVLALQLGAAAEKWLDRIRNPKSLIDKLGLKPEQRIAVLGVRDDAFDTLLAERGLTADRKLGKAPYDVILFGADSPADLDALPRCRAALAERGAIWIIYPKGRTDFKESDVLKIARGAGLVDTKVVSFSATHTGLRWVAPVVKRAATSTKAKKNAKR